MPADSRMLSARVAWFQASTVAALLIASLLVAGAAHGETSTIGRTFPIVETDALAEIEAKAATLSKDLGPKFGPRSRWTAMKSASLAPAMATRRRSVVPFYTLDMDVTLPDGRVLYPKGFTFNPLTYVSLPQRLVIVHAGELEWALKTATPTDWILLAAGSGAAADPIALGEKVGRPLFILEGRVKERLGLTVAPVIVRQVGQKLELTEIRLSTPGSASR
ncbi:conjugal transfer protein TraW [Sphingobium sp. V4]|uniref:conjugal transfer protein TraW n=1 Tax=Sphingobium sp. V4 TaxID=3038927 RepID=UPI002557CF60|nr:conjugal transfer protein TraW [Sphingobium sp. V4]WIW89552.1 conjugal transfer protein TraW [Sphingobium sp. V4]